MSPVTHGLSGVAIGLVVLNVKPEVGDHFGKGWFLLISVLAGQIPDVDCIFSFLTKSRNPLFFHRGIGHSLVFHLSYSLMLPCLIGLLPGSNLYLVMVFFFFIQIALHLIEDMFDGSFGIYYLSPVYNSPFACKRFALTVDIDENDLMTKTRCSKFRKLLFRRVSQEAFLSISLLFLIFFFLV